MTIISKRTLLIKEAIINALNTAVAQGLLTLESIPEFILEVPREKTHGDFATNIAMLLTKQAKMPPRNIATMITENFDKTSCGVSKIDIAGPGFINFTMEAGWLNTCLAEIVAQGTDFGKSNAGNGKKVQVEFVSANPTGELHMGNARGAAIGSSLAALLQMAGYDCQKEFYINDAGNQIDKFANSLEARYLQILGQDVEFPEDGYHGEDITRTMQRLIDTVGDKYEKVESSLRKEMLTRYALDKKITDIKSGLEAFGVHYDVWFSEQSLHDSGAITDIINQLQSKGVLYKKDDAIWLSSKSWSDEKNKENEKDEVLVRANGIPTYFAADIAYHDNKFKRGFEQVINIWGADHHGHVARMKGAMATLGYRQEQLDIILMQLVRLFKDGEILRMSKRTGTYITLQELIEEVGKDAARFFFVMRSADSQMDFDMDLAKSESADNPVYYVQYAHARICSILRSGAEQGYDLDNNQQIDFTLLHEASELDLIRRMADFPDEVAYAAEHMEPHRIAIYVQDLAGLFHNFYTYCRVLGEDKDVTIARLWLIKATAQTIAAALNALGVTAPERM